MLFNNSIIHRILLKPDSYIVNETGLEVPIDSVTIDGSWIRVTVDKQQTYPLSSFSFPNSFCLIKRNYTD